MSMNVGPGDGEDDVPMSDINTTPLVDVMLVMLIIFLITIPVVTQSVPMALPKVAYEATVTKPENISLSVRGEPDGSCGVYWNMTRVNSEELLNRAVKKLEQEIERQGGVENLTEEPCPKRISAATSTRPTLYRRGDFTMQRAGFARVGFISNRLRHGRHPL